MINELRPTSKIRVNTIDGWEDALFIDHVVDILQNGRQWMPIPLSMEELTALGFTYTPWREDCNCPGHYRKGVFNLGEDFRFGHTTISYVHQLQNMYLVWTGEEL